MKIILHGEHREIQMKKAILPGIRWSIDACLLAAMAWGFGWLFGIITRVLLLFDRLSFLGQMVNSEILYLGVAFVFPLLVGLILSILFALIVIKFNPSKAIYILVCAILVILPTLPSMINNGSSWAENDVDCLYVFYLGLSIVLSNFIYQRIKLISNGTSTPS